MKKITITALLFAGAFAFSENAKCQVNDVYFTENFDDTPAGQLTGTTANAPTTPTSYTLSSGIWTFYFAFRSGSGCNNDAVPVSAKAIRLLQQTVTTPSGIVMPGAYMISPKVNYGIGSISWNNAKNTAGSNTGIYKSQDGGTTWVLVSQVPTTIGVCDDYTLAVNDPLANKIKFTNENSTAQLDIDHITIRSYATVLPLTFESVRAYQKLNNVQIDWTTAQESNVDKFAVEKSTTGTNFTTLGYVSAVGNTSAKSYYSYTDAAYSNGNNFYRIQAIDKDGKQTYSSVLKVAISNAKTSVTIAPNPVRGKQLNVQFVNGVKGTYDVSVYNAGGQKVFSSKINLEEGSSTQNIILPATIKAGAYNVILNNGDNKITKGIIVE